jgi:hypothetical protein
LDRFEAGSVLHGGPDDNTKATATQGGDEWDVHNSCYLALMSGGGSLYLWYELNGMAFRPNAMFFNSQFRN